MESVRKYYVGYYVIIAKIRYFVQLNSAKHIG